VKQTQEPRPSKKRTKRKGDFMTEVPLGCKDSSRADVLSDDTPGYMALGKELWGQLNTINHDVVHSLDHRALAFSLLCQSWVLASGAMPPEAAAYTDAEDWELADLAW